MRGVFPRRTTEPKRNQMAKSLAQLEKQIQQLQRQADALRSKEVAGVIERIRVAIAHYNLTPGDLFGAKGSGAKKRATKATGNSAAKRPPAPPKYRGEGGQTWSGIGKRPNWFKAALAEGKKPEELAIKD